MYLSFVYDIIVVFRRPSSKRKQILLRRTLQIISDGEQKMSSSQGYMHTAAHCTCKCAIMCSYSIILYNRYLHFHNIILISRVIQSRALKLAAIGRKYSTYLYSIYIYI